MKSEEEQTPLEKWLDIEKKSKKPLLLIVDQIEEALTSKNAKANEIEDFLDILSLIFDVSGRPRGKAILTFRKEYLAEIKEQVEERRLAYTEVYLQRLSRNGIVEAITGITKNPLTRDKYKLKLQYEKQGDLTQIIADDLLHDNKGPLAPILQILLSRMWVKAKDHRFSINLYKSLKKKGILLQDFFDRQMATMEKKFPEAISSGLALDILNRHTTLLGTAATIPIEELTMFYNHRRKELPQIVQQLKDLYLLSQTETTSTALSHDYISPNRTKGI